MRRCRALPTRRHLGAPPLCGRAIPLGGQMPMTKDGPTEFDRSRHLPALSTTWPPFRRTDSDHWRNDPFEDRRSRIRHGSSAPALPDRLSPTAARRCRIRCRRSQPLQSRSASPRAAPQAIDSRRCRTRSAERCPSSRRTGNGLSVAQSEMTGVGNQARGRPILGRCTRHPDSLVTTSGRTA
jgi:hypothetical protein